MNPFDYLTILISIVLGLAIANVLTRLAAVITARERVDFYWPLLTPVDLFLLSALVLPPHDEHGTLDLGDWYFRNRAWFFAIMAFLPALSIAEELARTGRIFSWLNFAFLIAFEAVILLAYLLRSRRAQEWITAQAMVLTVIYVALLFLPLPS
jgi:hypothetical protein